MLQCFFYIEPNQNDPEDGIIRALCLECRKIQRPNNCWFHDGQVGPWDVICHRCTKTIYEHKEQDENASNNENSRREVLPE